jgi:outer membrane protein OmpA-like peptidoglycan-associated protein
MSGPDLMRNVPMRLRSTLVAATILAMPLAAAAQPISGVYIGAGAGYNYLAKLNVTTDGPPVPPNAVLGAGLQGNGGFIGSASVGYGLGNGFRIEVQGDYRQENQNLTNGTFVGGVASTASYGGYFNTLFDMDIGSPVFFPYLGAGVGFRETTLNEFHGYLPGQTNGYASNGSWAGAFSAQAMVGLAIAVYGVPGLSVTTEARWSGTFMDETFSATQNVNGGAPQDTGLRTSHQNNYSFLVGARYAFNVPPPPPLPAPAPVEAPAPAPARSYLVFFDWDRADLTDRAKQIIAEAASNVAKVQVTRIEVNGYADLSGTPAYNKKLSVRRAEAVAGQLVADGVAKNDIAIKGFGDTNPLVPTARGVREPQNRRVEIILK